MLQLGEVFRGNSTFPKTPQQVIQNPSRRRPPEFRHSRIVDGRRFARSDRRGAVSPRDRRSPASGLATRGAPGLNDRGSKSVLPASRSRSRARASPLPTGNIILPAFSPRNRCRRILSPHSYIQRSFEDSRAIRSRALESSHAGGAILVTLPVLSEPHLCRS